ncbi:hypothetical protein SO802_007629 [Lithocarpus litseifolius]|uniref:Reverse transcriptase domain-containing protein n=1 Tax=Lithocarpus litseifolius TaxID=425828 RepID=A0AAW2DQ18_9ROSI
MSIIVWNCRGALKSSFQNHVRELVHNHDPAIMVVMETRIGGDRAGDISDRLPFDGAIHSDTIGFSGGIWLLWNSDKVQITQLAMSEQEIHVLVKVTSSSFEFIFSAIYTSPRFHERCILWNNLKNAADLHEKPWIIAGDFNEVLADGDKFGGRAVNSNRSLLFKDCLDYCNMIDMGFTGPRFTWTNRCNINALVQERIDRFFANPSWCAAHPDARVTHLTRCVSDHCPVLLESNLSNGIRLPRPFKFQTFWLSDLSFPGIVSKAWGFSRPLQVAIDCFSKKASDWNKHHFGNIFGRKKRVLARLNGIQRALAENPSHSLVEMEKSLHKELNDILCQEEELWVQKSRINRLIEGRDCGLSNLIKPLVRMDSMRGFSKAFVPGRRSVDNAIVVQELIHTISNKKGRGRYMAIKVDLEKAYDKIELSFIREVFINANLLHNLVNLIMSCVSSISTSILFNGGNVEPIFPSRGIRQGDPLSPYLFILCMEVLGHLIEDKCSKKRWVPVKSSQSGMAFSHLFFTDDLVLFAKADHVNCSTIRDVLDDFCGRSGQSISESRTVLIQASTSTIPTYVMKCTALPKKLLDDIDRVNRNFLGGSSDSSKRTHWVGWHKVTKAKAQGGLGIQSARGRNQALLAKLNWRFRTEKDALWAKVLRSKYCNSRRLHARAKDKLHFFRVWKAIQKGSEVFHKGIRWIPGHNSSLSIWHDTWFAKAPLRTLIQGPLLEEEESLQVKEVFRPLGWDWSKISVQIPNDILMEINAMPCYLGASIEEDRLIWNGGKHRDFALKSAYSLATRCKQGRRGVHGVLGLEGGYFTAY